MADANGAGSTTADYPRRPLPGESGVDPSPTRVFRPPWLTYPVAAGGVLLAYAIRHAMSDVLGQRVPFGMFYASMFFGAWFGGFGPAVMAMVLGLLAVRFGFDPPLDVFTDRIENHIGLALYVFLGSAAALVSAAHERALRRAVAGEASARARELQLREEVAVRQAAEAAGREQDQLLRLTTDAAPVLVCYVDPTGRYRFANRTFRAWYRLPEDGGLETTTLARTLGPDEYALIEPRVAAALAGRPQEFEMARTDPRGEARLLWVHFAPDVTPTLLVRGFVVVITDVTESRRGETARTKLAAIVESSDDAIIGIDLNGLVTSWNEGAQQLLGYAPREIVGRPVRRLLPAEEAADVDDLLDRVRRGQSVRDRDAVRLRGDGSRVDVSVTVSPVRDVAGRITGAAMIARDVTEIKRVAAHLRASEERYRELAEALPQFVWRMRPDGTPEYINAFWFAYTGLTAGETEQGGWMKAIHPDDLPVVTAEWDAARREKRAYRCEYRVRRASDGEYRWFQARALAVTEPGGGVKWIGTAADIDDQKRARAEAERASRLKDEFLANLSHELRTPLNAILGWAQLLRGPGATDEEDLKVGLETIERNARVQHQLVEDLLDMSRIISGKITLTRKPVELGAVIEAAVVSVGPGVGAKRIALDVAIDPAAGPVDGDAARLQQIVWNLLANAIKFTPAGGAIHVALKPAGDRVEVVVGDSGAGIAAEFLPQVFERFIQADSSTTRRFGGMGMGLAIVRHLVELHGGTVRAASAGVGRGSTFTLSLPAIAGAPRPPDSLGEPPLAATPRAGAHVGEPPLAGTSLAGTPVSGTLLAAIPVVSSPDPAADPPMPQAPPPAAPNGATGAAPAPADLPPPASDASPRLDGLRVLVVDDDPDAREVVRRLLSGCRATVTTASSAAEALTSLDLQPPDVLVSDIGMPGEDGYALIRKVRSLPAGQLASVPAVALTAFAHADDRSRATQSGFQAHLPKPVEASALIAAIADLTGRGTET